ncbi:MAG: RloB family protein [Actinomycetaceae bacterium]|nr:RloB family protein [Actinomycetaceae bacterium]
MGRRKSRERISSRGRRPSGTRAPKPLVIVIVEGKTEEEYITLLKREYSDPLALLIKNQRNKTSLRNLLTSAKTQERENRDCTAVWIICDTDENATHKRELEKWLQEDRHHCCLSNPCFEYWLLLHYTDNPRHFAAKDAESRVQEYCAAFSKGGPIPPELFENYRQAAKRAQNTTATHEDLWSGRSGTTMYELIDFLDQLAGANNAVTT